MPRSILIQRRLRLILPCRSAAYEATSKRTQTNIKVSLCGVLQGGEPVPSKKEWIQKLLAKPGDKDLLGFLSCCDIALSAGQGTMLWHLKQQLVPDEARLGHTFVQRPASLCFSPYGPFCQLGEALQISMEISRLDLLEPLANKHEARQSTAEVVVSSRSLPLWFAGPPGCQLGS